MLSVPEKIHTWQMVQPASFNRETNESIPGRLEKTEIPVPELKEGEVLVEVAGCGVCHTDLSYFYEGTPTVFKPPLTLGHEISGKVVSGDEAWIGKEVIIPAVMPCRQCIICKTGHGNRCLDQKMPGNSLGIYGGFSDYIPVPSIDLCEISDRKGIPLPFFAALADAGTTPFQAAKRADLQYGDRVIIIGIRGGVGKFMGLIAGALGAGTVIGIDIKDDLEKALDMGADYVINAKGKDVKEISGEFKNICKQHNLPRHGWKIFEVSGSVPGQNIGLNLISFLSTMVVVGYNNKKVEYSISRLMAFEGEIKGTWGCLPEYYPNVLELALKGKIPLPDLVETRSMSTIIETFEENHKNPPDKRIVLTPDF
jgi:6-hydroxycyclohex-1-ene-1-carbonyl-CoA dehydrogenase